jgi:hypothetical protein
VIEVVEPLARQLAEEGRTPGGRRAILKHIGNALLVQHRVSGRVAVAEKPDGVWDRPDLERLYALFRPKGRWASLKMKGERCYRGGGFAGVPVVAGASSEIHVIALRSQFACGSRPFAN